MRRARKWPVQSPYPPCHHRVAALTAPLKKAVEKRGGKSRKLSCPLPPNFSLQGRLDDLEHYLLVVSSDSTPPNPIPNAGDAPGNIAFLANTGALPTGGPSDNASPVTQYSGQEPQYTQRLLLTFSDLNWPLIMQRRQMTEALDRITTERPGA
jgi:hypothetical protein